MYPWHGSDFIKTRVSPFDILENDFSILINIQSFVVIQLNHNEFLTFSLFTFSKLL